jgi:hypothetical protein
MPGDFLDTSALAKHTHSEVGEVWAVPWSIHVARR